MGRRRRTKSKSGIIIVLEAVFLVAAVVFCATVINHGAASEPKDALSQPPETNATDPVETLPPETLPPETLPVDTSPEGVIQAFAQGHGLTMDDYPEELVELLAKNPETEEFVLNYPLEYGQEHTVDLSAYARSQTVPLFMQWDRQWGYLDYGSGVAGMTACGPVCLSMVAYYLTGDENMSPDQMIRFAIDNGYCVPGNGTSWTLISEGGEKLGLEVTEIPLVESRMISNLEAGNPIICVMGPGVFTTTGHYIVLVGYEDGKYRINDPNSHANSERLWEFSEFSDQVRNLWVIQK